MSFVIDLIIILIVVFSSLYGLKKGFVLSCCNFLCGLASFVLTFLFARPLGSFLADSVFKPIFESYFTKAFSVFLSKQADSMLNEPFTAAAAFFKEFGLDSSILQNCYQSAGEDVDKFFRISIDAAASGISDSIGYAFALVLLFIGLFLLSKFIIALFNLISKLPILNFANRSLGLLFGMCFGLLISVLFVAAVVLLEPILQNSGVTTDSYLSVNETYIASFLSDLLNF